MVYCWRLWAPNSPDTAAKSGARMRSSSRRFNSFQARKKTIELPHAGATPEPRCTVLFGRVMRIKGRPNGVAREPSARHAMAGQTRPERLAFCPATFAQTAIPIPGRCRPSKAAAPSGWEGRCAVPLAQRAPAVRPCRARQPPVSKRIGDGDAEKRSSHGYRRRVRPK